MNRAKCGIDHTRVSQHTMALDTLVLGFHSPETPEAPETQVAPQTYHISRHYFARPLGVHWACETHERGKALWTS